MKYQQFWKNPGYKVRPELKNDISCDYLIIGGGVTGVSVAYFLSKFGAKNIVLIEKNHIASGATGKAAGTLVLRGETDLLDIIKQHGKRRGEILWKEIFKGLNDIKSIVQHEKIDCDAEAQDTLYCGFKHKSHNDLREEYKEENRIDKTAKFLKGKEFQKELNTNLYTHGILSANHGLSVNPLKLTQNLSKVVEKKYGVKIYENTSFLRANNHVAETHHGNIRYKKIIMATDVDHPETKNIKSTIIITQRLRKKELAKTRLNKRKIVFDNKKNYDYFKVTKDGRLLFGFGGIYVHKRHKKTDPHLPHLRAIENYMKKLFPYLKLKPEYAWSGSYRVTENNDPFIEFGKDSVSISGAGTQVVCFMSAKQVASKLLNRLSTA